MPFLERMSFPRSWLHISLVAMGVSFRAAISLNQALIRSLLGRNSEGDFRTVSFVFSLTSLDCLPNFFVPSLSQTMNTRFFTCELFAAAPLVIIL